MPSIREGEIFSLGYSRYEMVPVCFAQFLRDVTPEELMEISTEAREEMGEMPDNSPRALYYEPDFVECVATKLQDRGIARLLNPFEIIFEDGKIYKIVRRRIKHDGDDDQPKTKGGDLNALESK